MPSDNGRAAGEPAFRVSTSDARTTFRRCVNNQDGGEFPMDWIARYHRRRAQRRHQDKEQIVLWRQTSESLAKSIQQLCGLCDDLIDVIESTEVAEDKRQLMETLPAKVASVRQYALSIAAEANIPGSGANVQNKDPYSLAELRKMMDNMSG